MKSKATNSIILIGFLAIIACGKPNSADMVASAPAGGEKAIMEQTDASAPIEPSAGKPNEKTIINAPMLAYSYAITILLPQNNLETQLKEHIALCEKAGVQVCQIINTNIMDDETNKNASLNLRAQPNWLQNFRNGLEQIIASRPGKLADLLEAEKELARVQAEIDSFNSNLAIAKARVEMSELSLNYQSRANAVNNGIFAELLNAFSDFFRIMFNSLAFLIRALAAIMPFAIIGIPAIIFIGKFLKKRKAAKELKPAIIEK